MAMAGLVGLSLVLLPAPQRFAEMHEQKSPLFFASQDALEVMRVTHWLTYLLSDWVDISIDFTYVTLVSEDTFQRLYWCDPDDPDESYLVMKVI